MKSEFMIEVPPRLQGKEGLDSLLHQMVVNDGSDLFLPGGHPAIMDRYGRKEALMNRALSDSEAKDLISTIYGHNAPSLLGGGEPINCSYEFKLDVPGTDGLKQQRYRFRVNAVHCFRFGKPSLTVTLRTIPSIPPDWRVLGVEPLLIEETLGLKQGLIVVVGATGEGKSTLMSSMLRARLEHPTAHTNLVTIEAPIEFVYDEVVSPTSFSTQIEIGRSLHSFNEAVENALRMKPNLILVGESRDFATTRASLQAALTGHGVFTTVHSNSAPETVQRLVYTYPESLQSQARDEIVQPLRIVISQRLVPRVDGKRIAVREYMIVDQQDKNALASAKNVTEAAFKVLENHGRPLIEDAHDKFKEGLISDDTFKYLQRIYQNSKNEEIQKNGARA